MGIVESCWIDLYFYTTDPDLTASLLACWIHRMVAYDVDMFGEPNFIGQYSVPVQCLRSGYRSANLKNAFSEDLELSGRALS